MKERLVLPKCRLRKITEHACTCFLIGWVILCGPERAAAQGANNQADPRALFSRARASEDKGDFKQAERLYARFLQVRPNSAEGHANLGVVYEHLGETKQAIREYDAALTLDPSLSGTYLNLGIAHFRNGEYEKAIPPLRHFASLQPANRQGRELLGLSYVETNRFSDAVRVLDTLRATHDPAVLLALAASYVRLGQMTRAQDAVKTLLTTQPDSPRVHFLLGQTFAGLHDFPRALSEFEVVHSLDPQWPQIELLLGAAEANLGEFRQAEYNLRNQLKSSPGNFETNYTLGALLNKERRFRDAIPYLVRAIRENPHSGEALYELARGYWEAGHSAKAWTTVQLALKADARNRQAHYLYAEMARTRGDQETARREFAKAKSLSEIRAEEDILRLSEQSEAPRHF